MPAVCIHGAMERNGIFHPLRQGIYHIRNGENAETEYYYGEDKLIYKIVDANGGITRHQYNSFQELEVTVNPTSYTVRPPTTSSVSRSG